MQNDTVPFHNVQALQGSILDILDMLQYAEYAEFAK
jgi:hypothetical protein